MKKLFLSIFVMFAGVCLLSAQQKNYAHMMITDAYLDEEDCSDLYAEEGAFLAFYKSDAGDFCMANVWPNAETQSYGAITDWVAYHNEATEEDYASDEFHFNWHYSNSYDDNTGVASCVVFKVYKPEGILYALFYQLEDGSMAVYSGAMNGEFDEFAKVMVNSQSNGLIGVWAAEKIEALNEDGDVMMTIDAKNAGISIICNFLDDSHGVLYEGEDSEKYDFSYVYDEPTVYISEDGEVFELQYVDGMLYMETFDEVHMRVCFKKAE